MKRQRTEHCELCGREKPLTFHHLIPRKMHRKRWVRERFTKVERTGRGLWLCHLCHRHIHRHFSEKELAESLNTRETLAAHEEMRRFLPWARKQK